MDESNPQRDEAGECFATTHWTRVLAARGESPAAKAALSELCANYYGPVVAFLRARSHDDDRARELAHDFFQRLLERNSIGGADPNRGRFRSYLLGAVKHFAADMRDRELAARRGGQVEHVSLDPGTDTSPGIDPPAQGNQSPDVAFDRQWALTILDRALETLASEHKSAERQRQFDLLKPWLTGGGTSQAEIAARLGMNEGAVKVAVHRLRKRFRELVKAEIAATVNSQSDVQEEMSYLVTVLSR
ncbi:sigma-70 family RNA polymerase sigma factor [bacterium]|nr:sigma-70 family RNA polymerase sigma factor [bacterium]